MTDEDELELEDQYGDVVKFTRRQDELAPAEVEVGDTAVILRHSQVRGLADWLDGVLGVDRLDEQYSMLTLQVPGAAGGAPRELTWSGPGDTPEWFVSLANIAMGGAPGQPSAHTLQAEYRAGEVSAAEDREGALKGIAAGARELNAKVVTELQARLDKAEAGLKGVREQVASEIRYDGAAMLGTDTVTGILAEIDSLIG